MEEKKKKVLKKPKDDQELKAMEEKYLRTLAELANYRKRKDEEVNNIYKYANETLLKELLPVLDNFERAVKMDDSNLTDELSQFLKGFEIIYVELGEIFKTYGVTEIEALEKEFDPNYMEAVFVVEDEEGKTHNVVLDVLQKGYMYKDKLLRPAMVKVSK